MIHISFQDPDLTFETGPRSKKQKYRIHDAGSITLLTNLHPPHDIFLKVNPEPVVMSIYYQVTSIAGLS
jgi:hypothetical protein